MELLQTEFTTQMADATPVIVAVIGAIIALVFILAVGRFVQNRVRGTVK